MSNLLEDFKLALVDVVMRRAKHARTAQEAAEMWNELQSLVYGAEETFQKELLEAMRSLLPTPDSFVDIGGIEASVLSSEATAANAQENASDSTDLQAGSSVKKASI